VTDELTCPECGYRPSRDEPDLDALPGSPWIIDFDLKSGREIETYRCPECHAVADRYDPWAQEGDR